MVTVREKVNKKVLGGVLMLLLVGIMAEVRVQSASAATSTLSLSISNSTVAVGVSPTNSSGSFNKSPDTTISASTDNATGYTLSIAAPSGAGADYDKLINGDDSSAKLTSISSATTEETFKGLNSTSYNGKWGYLPSKYCSNGTSSTCVANSDFLPAPTTTGDTLDVTSAANSTANTYTIAVGARVDSSVKTGSYSNTYVVKLVGNAIPYSITYNDGVVSNMPNDVSSTTPDSTVNISSNVPVRDGYKFLGWCAGTVTTTSGTDSCSGTIYNPNGGGTNLTYTLDQTGGANVLSLIAMWKEVTYLQNLSADKCTTTMSTATDSRDGTEYHIQRLADGKCWMLDNLALDLVAKIDDLNEDNTNASNTTLGYLKNGGGSTTSGDATYKYASAGVANWTSSYSFSAPLVNISNKDTVPQGSDPMASTVLAGNWKVGGYYNYCAASAGSYCYGNGTSQGTSTGNASEDICPKGWRMPTGNTSDEYSALANAIYGSTGSTSDSTAYTNYRTALHIPLSGKSVIGSVDNQGMDGFFWSSTRRNNGSMYALYVGMSGIYPADGGGLPSGYSVRCVLGS